MLEDYIDEFEKLEGQVGTLIDAIENQTSLNVAADSNNVRSKLRDMKEYIHQIEMEIYETSKVERRRLSIEQSQRKHILECMVHRWGQVASVNKSVPRETAEKARTDTLKLQRATEDLDASYRAAIETEVIGEKILSNLHQQREKIEGIKTQTEDIQNDLDDSHKMLKKMGSWWNKWLGG